MTGNKFFLTDYQEIDGGFVAFGESLKGGKIYGKGKIKTGKLDFEDVYFVKKLKVSLFSVSQMCDEKNSVLFTETECLVLSPNFKLLDENQVLLKVPRHNNMYSFDLKNVAPGYVCNYTYLLPTRSFLLFKTLFLDVKNAFLHGHLTKTVYMHQPPGSDSAHSDYVCFLQKSLYDLKQPPLSLVSAIVQLCYSSRFLTQQTDSSLSIFHKGINTAYLLLYMDDIILTASFTSLMQCIISLLHEKFAMKDLGPLNYFLGISAMRTTAGIFMFQTKYATKILELAQMLNCNPCRTQLTPKRSLDLKNHASLILLYIAALPEHFSTSPLPDLIFHMQCNRTTGLGLKLFWSTTSQLIAYSDADWAGCRATRRFNSGHCSKHQDTLSRSISEAEYHGVANVVAKTFWIRDLLHELHALFFHSNRGRITVYIILYIVYSV
nr:hypothetical protein [Tanacetum cinerariifolium]